MLVDIALHGGHTSWRARASRDTYRQPAFHFRLISFLLVWMQAAFRAVATEVYGELCPFDRFNDVTLARCFSVLGILKFNDDSCHSFSIVEDAPQLAEQIHNQASVPEQWLMRVAVT